MVKYLFAIIASFLFLDIAFPKYFYAPGVVLEFMDYKVCFTILSAPFILLCVYIIIRFAISITDLIFCRQKNLYKKRCNVSNHNILQSILFSAFSECIEESEKSFKRAVRLNPKNCLIKFSNGLILKLKGLEREALAEFTSIINSEESDRSVLLASIRLVLDIKDLSELSLEEIENLTQKARGICNENVPWANDILYSFYKMNKLWHNALKVINAVESNKLKTGFEDNFKYEKPIIYAIIASEYAVINNKKSYKYWDLAIQNSKNNIAIIYKYSQYLILNKKHTEAMKMLCGIFKNKLSKVFFITALKVIESANNESKIRDIIKILLNCDKRNHLYYVLMIFAEISLSNLENASDYFKQMKYLLEKNKNLNQEDLVFAKIVASVNDKLPIELISEVLINTITSRAVWVCSNGCRKIMHEPHLICDSCGEIGSILELD